MSTSHARALRHVVATLRYRMNNVLEGAPESFPDYALGAGVRTPSEILDHVGDVLAFAHATLIGERRQPSTAMEWDARVERFLGLLIALDSEFARAEGLDDETALRLLQGPLSDALTHVGQLAMIRRVAGAPVAGENFFVADIRAGSGEA